MKLGKLCCAIFAFAMSVSASAQDNPKNEPEFGDVAPTVPPPPPAPAVAPAPVAPPAPVPVPVPGPRIIPRPATDFVGSEEKIEWFQSPAIFLPGDLEAGEGQVFERETMFTVPLAWAVAGRLTSDLSITVDGKGIDLKAGAVLPQVAPRKAAGVDERYRLFCTRSRTVQEAKTDTLTHIFGTLANSLRDAQWCLQDTDSDGLLDLAVVLNAGAPVTKADDIEPVAVEQVFGEKIDGDGDTISFRLERVGKTSLALSFAISQEGSELNFHTLTSGKHEVTRYSSYTLRDGPRNFITILGVQFQIVMRNRRENWAQIRWKATAQGKRDFVVIPTRLTTTFY